MKKLFSLLLSLSSIAAMGQNPGPSICQLPPKSGELRSPNSSSCDNTGSNTNPDYINKYKKIETYIPDNSTPIKHIKIAVNVFTGPVGVTIQNNPTEIAAIEQMINWVNGFYTNLAPASYPINGVTPLTDTKIRFDLDSRIFFYEGTNLSTNSSISTLQNYITSVDPTRLNYLNIYITGGGATAYAIPPNLNLTGDEGVYFSSISASFINAQTLAHELGHCLDLFHTYEPSCCHETCDTNDPDYLYDLFGTNPPAYCWIEAICTNNMLGGHTLLNYYFSPMQIGKMHRSLSIKSVRKYVKETPYDPVPHNILTNELWNFDIRWYSDIVVKTGTILTVTCKIYMADQAKIIVERGAQLIIDEGTITSGYQMWQGIEVWGDRTKSQLLTSGIQYQGKVILKNDATIENAREGMTTIKTNSGSYDWNYTGGIIQAVNSNFLNCRRAVAYLSYQNINPINLSPINNVSYFRNCKFLTTKQLNDVNTVPYSFASLYDVQGVRFLGNIFKNSTTSTQNQGYKGDGIISVDAKYSINPYCTTIPPWGTPCPSPNSVRNKFENLRYGVHASAGMSPLNTLTVNEADFINNKFGIYIKAIDYPTITNNTFDVGGVYGVYLDNSTGFKLENNTFNSTHNGLLGSLINDSKYFANAVYNNYYSNLFVGNVAANDNFDIVNNVGLKIICNDFTSGNDFDIAVLPLSNINTDIDPLQGLCVTGNPRFLVRNLYSAVCAGNENQYYIDKSTTSFIFHANSTETWAEPLCKDNGVLTGDCSGMLRDRVQDCPSTLINSHRTITLKIASINQQLAKAKKLVDGGEDQKIPQIGVSARRKGEQEISFLNWEKDLLVSDKIRLALNDTTYTDAIDSVIKIMRVEGRTNIRGKLIDIYIEKRDFISAKSEINALRKEGGMDDFCKFKELIIKLYQTVDGAYKMKTDRRLKAEIMSFVNDSDKVSCKYAQSLLEKVLESQFKELIFLPAKHK